MVNTIGTRDCPALPCARDTIAQCTMVNTISTRDCPALRARDTIAQWSTLSAHVTALPSARAIAQWSDKSQQSNEGGHNCADVFLLLCGGCADGPAGLANGLCSHVTDSEIVPHWGRAGTIVRVFFTIVRGMCRRAGLTG
eukprot:g41038.t1